MVSKMGTSPLPVFQPSAQTDQTDETATPETGEIGPGSIPTSAQYEHPVLTKQVKCSVYYRPCLGGCTQKSATKCEESNCPHRVLKADLSVKECPTGECPTGGLCIHRGECPTGGVCIHRKEAKIGDAKKSICANCKAPLKGPNAQEWQREFKQGKPEGHINADGSYKCNKSASIPGPSYMPPLPPDSSNGNESLSLSSIQQHLDQRASDGPSDQSDEQIDW